jgi:hypothetical protein
MLPQVGHLVELGVGDLRVFQALDQLRRRQLGKHGVDDAEQLVLLRQAVGVAQVLLGQRRL